MSIPRSGRKKPDYSQLGYDWKQDGAEYYSESEMTMSWSSFLYSQDVWLEVQLIENAGKSDLLRIEDVTIRPIRFNSWEKELVNKRTVAIRVPYDPAGFRFSVEFEFNMMMTQHQSEDIHRMPKDALMIFAEPMLDQSENQRLIPSCQIGSQCHFPEPGHLNLVGVTDPIINFQPGVYYMTGQSSAELASTVRWLYLAPGAYVKGAFQFAMDSRQTTFKVTGFGVLSTEQYVYETHKDRGYTYANSNDKMTCHNRCVKALAFKSDESLGQSLEIHGVTLSEPSYHSFVVYPEAAQSFPMKVSQFKQVGAWYWQTDGLELTAGSTMKNAFIHCNDDAMKLYTSNQQIENVVVWKGDNGPVFQLGWKPRRLVDVLVNGVDIIHNNMRMGADTHNTCIINGALNMFDTKDIDDSKVIRNMTLAHIHAEGRNMCAIRFFVMSHVQQLTIDSLSIDSWNGQDLHVQQSLFQFAQTRSGDLDQRDYPVASEYQLGKPGLLLKNYAVSGAPILKAGNNWQSSALGRLNFQGELWDHWDAVE
jgi:hypothetical protein